MAEPAGENISVSVRVRPINKREEETAEKQAWRIVDGHTIYPNEHNPRKNNLENPFAFDNVFDQDSTAEQVYDLCARNIINSAMEGRNGTIFCYGQTSSGKTHTMHGNPSCPGIVPRAISFIFDKIKNDPTQDFLVRCSYIEIYNENITDLLNTKNTNLKIHTNPKGGVFVADVTMPVVGTAEVAQTLITKGSASRHVGATNMNSESSRSHSIFRMLIESKDKKNDVVRVAELNMVDLAGSERQSQTQATGARLKEGANINKSLLTLGNVIAKLSTGERSHVPFRDSKLTRILEPALGGNSRTAIICTITPAAMHSEETISTLKFATRAKSITTKSVVNEDLDDQAMLKKYKKEIDNLKKKLRYTSAGGDKDLEICQMINQMESLQATNDNLIAEKSAADQKISKLSELVLLGGVNLDANVPSKKSKPSSRQSWCPSGASSGPLLETFRPPARMAPLGGGIAEGDETEGAPRSSLEGEADMSMCSRESSPAISETSTAASAQSSAAADAGLRAENEELRARISEEISAAAAQREALEKERDELMAALSSERDEIARVGAQAIGESEGRIAELEGRISELEVALEEAKSSGVAAAAGKDAEIASQAKLLGDRDAEITDKDAEIERIGQVLAEKEASLSEKDAALAAAVGERDAEVEKASQNLAERDATLAERDAEIASQTKLLAERDAEISSIRAALSAGESALEKAMSDKAELASEKASLQARLNEAEESLARAQSMLEQGEAELASLRESDDKYSSLVSQLKADLDQAKEIAAAAEAASEEAGFNAEREKARLEESMSSAAEAHKAELEQLMNQLVETEDALENIKNEHQELRMTEQELRVEIEDLTAELSKGAGKKGGSRISMYVGGGGGADKRMSVYAGKGGAEPSGDAASLRRELGAKEQRAADAEKAKEKLERQAEHLKGELAAMKEENGALKKENRDKKCRLAALEKSKDDGEKDGEKLKSKVAAAEEKVKVLTAEKSQAVSDKSSAEREARALSGKLESLTKDSEKLRSANQKMKEVQAACAAAEKRSETLSSELDKAAAALDDALTNSSRLEEELAATAAELDNAVSLSNDLEAQLGSTKEELENSRSMLTEVEGMCEELSQRKTELEKEIDGVRSERDVLSTGKAEVEASLKIAGEKLAVSEKSAEGLRTANDGLQSDLDEAEQQVDSLSKRVEGLKGDVARLSSFEESNKDLREQIKSLREEQSTTFASLTDANFELQQLKTEYTSLEEDAKEQQANLAKEKERLNEKLSASLEEQALLRKQFAEFSDTTALLDTTRDLESKVARLEGELATSVEREATLEAKIVSLQESLTESALNHQALQDERDAVIEEKTTLSQEVARFVEDAKRRDAEQKDVEQVFEEHHKYSSKLESDIATLKEQLASSERGLEKAQVELEAEKRHAEEEKGRATEQLASLKQEKESLQHMIEETSRSNGEVSSQILKLSDDINAERAAKLEVTSDLNKALLEKDNLSSKLAEMADANEKLSAARAELEGQVSSLKASYAEVEESMSSLREKYESEGGSAMEEIGSMQANLEKERSKRRTIQADLQAVQEQLREAQCELEMQQAAVSTSDSEVMRLRQLIEESRERQSEVEEERAAHSQALLDAEAAKSRLEKELRIKCEELEDFTAEKEKELKAALHKMTMIKAEYTGRVQRRERKIESLKDTLTEAGIPIPEDVEDNKAPATRASSKSARAEVPVDKENIRSNNVQRMR